MADIHIPEENLPIVILTNPRGGHAGLLVGAIETLNVDTTSSTEEVDIVEENEMEEEGMDLYTVSTLYFSLYNFLVITLLRLFDL